MAEAQEAKKTRARKPKAAPKADLVDMAAAPAAQITEDALEILPASEPVVPKAQLVQAEAAFSSVQEKGNALREAMREAVTVSAQGALEVNDKIIEALNVQRDAAIDLWRSAIGTPPLPEALQIQTHATRQAYEAASAQWQDIAATTARWITRSFEPLQSALHRPGR